jgi:hypothetical protein
MATMRNSTAILCVALALATGGCDDTLGPQGNTLTLTITGTGAGSVQLAPLNQIGGGSNCTNPATTSCSAFYSSPAEQVTLTATAANGSEFAGWSGACEGTGQCNVTMIQARSVTATFNALPVGNTLSLTIAGSGGGTVLLSAGSQLSGGTNCANPTATTCTAFYTSPTQQVTLTPSAAAGSVFAGWAGACSGTGACTVTMNQSHTVTALFNATGGGNLLTINIAGNGTGSVALNPAGEVSGSANCFNPTAASCVAFYSSPTQQVTLTATAATGSVFAGLSGACTGTALCTVTMNQSRSVTATFTR